MVLSWIVFSRDYSFWSSLGISVFHSIAAFNNAGFDILGGMQNLIPYRDSVLLNLTTAGLIIISGLGFVTITEIYTKRKFKKFSMHTKIVLVMTIILLVAGTILLKLTEGFSWLDAFFHSVSARTARILYGSDWKFYLFWTVSFNDFNVYWSISGINRWRN